MGGICGHVTDRSLSFPGLVRPLSAYTALRAGSITSRHAVQRPPCEPRELLPRLGLQSS